MSRLAEFLGRYREVFHDARGGVRPRTPLNLSAARVTFDAIPHHARKVNTTDEPGVDYREIAKFLWKLLDDIDTASDVAKGNDRVYRQIVETLQRRRFRCGVTDGHEVGFRRLDSRTG